MTFTPLPAELLLKPEAVARWLGCSRAVIYRMAKRGELPSVTVAGKLVRFLPEDVNAYIAVRRKGGTR